MFCWGKDDQNVVKKQQSIELKTTNGMPLSVMWNEEQEDLVKVNNFKTK